MFLYLSKALHFLNESYNQQQTANSEQVTGEPFEYTEHKLTHHSEKDEKEDGERRRQMEGVAK